MSSIHQAAKDGDMKLLMQQIAVGVDINIKDRYGATPLTLASNDGRIKLVMKMTSLFEVQRKCLLIDLYFSLQVEYLIHQGADLTAANKYCFSLASCSPLLHSPV